MSHKLEKIKLALDEKGLRFDSTRNVIDNQLNIDDNSPVGIVVQGAQRATLYNNHVNFDQKPDKLHTGQKN